MYSFDISHPGKLENSVKLLFPLYVLLRHTCDLIQGLSTQYTLHAEIAERVPTQPTALKMAWPAANNNVTDDPIGRIEDDH